MPTVMNMNEAKANFSGLLSYVRKDRATVTIMRYGRNLIGTWDGKWLFRYGDPLGSKFIIR